MEYLTENYCGANCAECGLHDACKGCKATCGKPFGGSCIAAEYIRHGGMKAFNLFKETLLREINALPIPGLPEIKELYQLNGSYVNLAYPLPGGNTAKFLKDENIYLGTQVEPVFEQDDENGRCFGIVAGMDFILVAEYGCNGQDPELVLFQHR